MKFKYEDLRDSILCSDSWEEKDLHLVEESDWTQDGKYQYRDIIFKHQDKHYIIAEGRSGSPFSHWEYEEHDVDKDGFIECEEVFEQLIIKKEWVSIPKKTILDELRAELNEANSLLYDAKDLLNNIHGYDTDTYRDIVKYLYGEEDEESEE